MEPVGSLRPATSPYPEPDQPSPCLPSIFLKTILILSFHVRSGTLPRGFPNNALYAPLLSSIRATCPAYSCFDHPNYITCGLQIVKLLWKKNGDYVSLNNIIFFRSLKWSLNVLTVGYEINVHVKSTNFVFQMVNEFFYLVCYSGKNAGTASL